MARKIKTLFRNPNQRNHREHRSKRGRRNETKRRRYERIAYKKRLEELHLKALE